MSFTFNGGTYNGAQFATHINNIGTSITGIRQSGDSDMASALEALELAVTQQSGLSDEQRQNLIGNVDFLAHTAQTPPASRNREVVRTVLKALSSAAQTGSQLAVAMETWENVLHRL